MNPHLIACVLGGTAPRSRTELHDVAFAVGNHIEEVHEQLLDSWFGTPEGLHVDAWTILDSIAGFRVQLRRQPANNDLHLYFVNIGGYRRGEFGERHAWGFFASSSVAGAKAQAKAMLLPGHDLIHKDDMYQVDDCIALRTAHHWHICLEPDPSAVAAQVTNGYFPLPAATIRKWRTRQPATGLASGPECL